MKPTRPMPPGEPDRALSPVRSRPIRRLAIALVFLGSVGSAPLNSQTPGDGPQAAFEGQTLTLAVEVPVEVTLQGEPVRGLDAESFRLYDGRTEQKILSVEEVDLGRLSGDVAEDPLKLPVAARRHFLLLFDRTYARPAALTKSREAAERLVREDLHPADLVAVASYGRGRGAELVLSFTSDREEVLAALAALASSDSRIIAGDPLRLSIASVSSGGDGAGDGGGGGVGARGVASAAAAEAARELRDLQDRAGRTERVAEIGVMTRSLGALAEQLRGLDGRKHVVLFSEGFDDSLLTGTRDDERRAEIQRQTQDNALWRVDSDEYFGSTAAFDLVDAMNEHFRRAGATVHTVDIGGLRAGGNVGDVGRAAGGGRASSVARSGRGGLFMIADGTGGELFENFNHLGEAMGRLLQRTSVTYVLTFEPQDLEPDGSFHKLKVKIDGLPRRARISHRAGYFAPDSGAQSGIETQLDLASRLLDNRRGSIGVEIHARGDIDQVGQTSILVEVDAASFFARTPTDQTVRAELYLYAFTPGGQVAARSAQAASLAPGSLPPGEQTFTMRAPLELADGTYTLRALVRHPPSGRTGARRLTIHVTPQMAIASTAEDVVQSAPTPPREETLSTATPEGRVEGRAEAGQRLEMDAFAASYAGILDRLDGEAPFHDLVKQLADSEVRALGERGERTMRRLEHVESRLARNAAGDGLKILVLHHDLALEHRREKRPWLAHLALERARHEAKAIASRSPSPWARRVTAAALASLGGTLQEQGRRASRTFFEAAIEVDPGSEAARLGLAADFEKRGGPWDLVTQQLQALVERRPESREGHLRLAINLLRASQMKGAMDVAGKEEKAASLFKDLLGPGDWVDALAAQELARRHLTEGRLKKAERILSEALERRPRDQETRVLLAFTLDRARRAEASRRILAQAAEIRSAEAESEITPRARYNRWPSQALGEARALLASVVAGPTPGDSGPVARPDPEKSSATTEGTNP